MKIFRKKVDVDNLTELLQRKQRLADKMQQQRQELRQTLGALKEDLTPARLLKYTMRSFSKPADSGLLNTIIQNPASIRLATDFAVNTLTRNSKRARLLRILLPILIQAIPTLVVVAKNLFRKNKGEAAEEPSADAESAGSKEEGLKS